VTLQLAVFARHDRHAHRSRRGIIAAVRRRGPANWTANERRADRSVGAELQARADGHPGLRHRLPDLPASGFVSVFDNPVESFRHRVMPAIRARIRPARSRHAADPLAMIDAMSTDYVAPAKAKGLGSRQVVVGHALRNSLIVVTTIVGPAARRADLRRRGHRADLRVARLREAHHRRGLHRDYPMIQGVVLVTATAYIVINLLVDSALQRDRPAGPGGRAVL
jgi:peptide/nickel transport system permease protein